MQSTASEESPSSASPSPERYRFQFSWEGPYGKAVNLVGSLAPAGIVLDLGCGFAPIGEVLRARGRTYVGVDRESLVLADMAHRDLEGHLVDLSSVDGLADRLVEVVSERPVGAVLALDIIEHLPEPESVLRELARVFGMLLAADGSPPVLVVSIPNVAHFDLAAKLVGGRWDVTPTGLLDRTHLQLFTEARVRDELGQHGWRECARDDVVLAHSDQWFPGDHPLLVEGGPAHDYLRSLRTAADGNAVVNQFVRAYRFESQPAAGEREIVPALAGPFLSVLTRTLGDRMGMLEEALSCLAAQTMDAIEVIVLVHSPDPQAAEAVRTLVESFDERFASKVRVDVVVGGGRGTPLNVGLSLAHGRYVAFLDDDDLVTADWAAEFHSGADRAPGKVIRSVCHARHVRRASPTEAAMGAVPVTMTKPVADFASRFDALIHFAANETPISSFAIPIALVRESGLGFDEGLPLCEDWDLLLRAALLVGVEDTGKITSVYQRWEDDGSTSAQPGTEDWPAAHAAVLAGLDRDPLLLPAGSASEIARLIGDPDVAREREASRQARLERGQLETEAEALRTRAAELEERAVAAEEARAEMVSSEFWRMTAPLRAVATRWRTRRSPKPDGS